MASHAPQTLFFVTNQGSVSTTGGSTRIAKGQLGLVDKGGVPTAAGLPVVTTVTPIATDRNRLYELRLGIAPLTPTRSQSNKAYSTVPFKLSEIVDVKVNYPKLGLSVDEFIIGYNGINPDTALVMSNGDNEVIDITLSGEAIGMLGYPEAKVTVKLYLEAPNTGTFTMHEIVEKGVERLKNVTLVGGVSILNYIDITPVNSTNPSSVTGTDFTFWTLELEDKGNHTALGLVQAQYPGLVVKRESFRPGTATSGTSVYVVLSDSGSPNTFNLVTGYAADTDCDGIPDTSLSTAEIKWVEGKECTAIEKKYTIQLADTECGEQRNAELAEAYPDLSIETSSNPDTGDKIQGACQTQYETTVLTSVVCEDCSPLLRDLFVAEAPAPFMGIHWTPEATTYDGTALMGIHLKGKVNILAGGEEYRDELPFVYSSTRLSIANAAPGMVSESFNIGTNGRFAVKLMSIATEPEAMGGQFYDMEERTRVYFENRQRLAGNNYGKLVLGQESHLKPTAQYVDYVVRVRTNRFAQSFSGEVVENFDYHILVEAGYAASTHSLLTALAAGNGITLPALVAGY
jgi:hypothetical protein